MRESEENPIFEWSCSDLEKIDTKWDQKNENNGEKEIYKDRRGEREQKKR